MPLFCELKMNHEWFLYGIDPNGNWVSVFKIQAGYGVSVYVLDSGVSVCVLDSSG